MDQIHLQQDKQRYSQYKLCYIKKIGKQKKNLFLSFS